ncbi:hypothetical protein ABZ671_25335 [Micromonospora sp. NPDC006766]|uniref:hypothetical protein n=1 Tax=Micromonospora sp. NPDC006766 TaxID=3154778 RepID=UPI0033CA28A4
MVGRPLRRLSQQNDEFRQDWYGTPARPGRDAVPGVPERLRRIETELHPNSGGTLRDAINRVEARLGGVETRLDDHIRSHRGGAINGRPRHHHPGSAPVAAVLCTTVAYIPPVAVMLPEAAKAAGIER